jgi:t-SNARE complex subunit (syntaxin)
MAGELWLLLIQLAGKVKHAEGYMPRIHAAEIKEMVDDFIESGDRLTDKLKPLLKSCEEPILKLRKKQGKKATHLAKNAGTEFVDSIFGRDRQLDATEKFMSSV